MERPSKRAKLLSDVDSSDESEEERPVANGFKVNQDFAKRFEHNKKREEKHRLEEKYGPASSSKRKADTSGDDGGSEDGSSSEDISEDDDAEFATQDVDDEIMATLQAIKNKDPRLYDQNAKFYHDFEVDAEGVKVKKDKEKPMYLQDYHRQNLLAGNTGDDFEEVDTAPRRTYQQEQDAMKRQLVDSMHAPTTNGIDPDAEDEEEDDDDDLLVTKSKPKHDALVPASTTHKDRAKQITDREISTADADPETYLSNFMAARAWLPNESSRWQAFDSDDSEEEKRADQFEEAYNLRFEDPAAANEKLKSFSRDVGKFSVRREEKLGGRQKAREREREKKEAARLEREEERARLRKLKIEEAEEKVKKIRQAAGMRGQEVDLDQWKDVIDGDFDDDKWGEEMQRRFGEDYYAEQEDGDAIDDDEDEDDSKSKSKRLKKPKWEDDIDIKDLVPEFEDEDGKGQFTLSDEDEAEVLGRDQDGSDAEHPRKRSKSKKDHKKAKAESKRLARAERRQIEDLVDSSLPINHPSLSTSINQAPAASASTTAPLPGFRYRDTSPTSFGLSAKDILYADDKQLNEYAGLKKMAAWRDEGKKARDRRKFSKKGRLREWRREVFGGVEGPKDVDKGGGGTERTVGNGWRPEPGIKGDEREGGVDVKEGERKGKKRKRSKKKGDVVAA